MNSIRNNKKHRLDELFRQKLSNIEITPTEEVKQRFLVQVKSNKRKVKPIWYFSAAASLLLISSMSWFAIFRSESAISEVKNPLIDSSVAESVELNSFGLSNYTNKLSKLSTIERQNTRTQSLDMAKNSHQKKLFVEPIETINNVVLFEEQKPLTGVLEVDELIQDKLTIALQAAERKRSELELKESDVSSNKELFQKSVGETVIIVSSELEPDIFIPELNSDSPISLAEATDLGLAKMDEERSLFAKVFTELKHLKHGEKVSLNDLTASSEKSFINNEDSFLGHETIEFRERYKWLKGKLTKE
jgi:hypothetical protein